MREPHIPSSTGNLSPNCILLIFSSSVLKRLRLPSLPTGKYPDITSVILCVNLSASVFHLLSLSLTEVRQPNPLILSALLLNDLQTLNFHILIFYLPSAAAE